MKNIYNKILLMFLSMFIISCNIERMNTKKINDKRQKSLYFLCSLFVFSNSYNNGYQNGLFGGRVPNFDEFGRPNPYALKIMEDKHSEARNMNNEWITTGYGGIDPMGLERTQLFEMQNSFGSNTLSTQNHFQITPPSTQYFPALPPSVPPLVFTPSTTQYFPALPPSIPPLVFTPSKSPLSEDIINENKKWPTPKLDIDYQQNNLNKYKTQYNHNPSFNTLVSTFSGPSHKISYNLPCYDIQCQTTYNPRCSDICYNNYNELRMPFLPKDSSCKNCLFWPGYYMQPRKPICHHKTYICIKVQDMYEKSKIISNNLKKTLDHLINLSYSGVKFAIYWYEIEYSRKIKKHEKKMEYAKKLNDSKINFICKYCNPQPSQGIFCLC